jgi:hypothetical protein
VTIEHKPRGDARRKNIPTISSATNFLPILVTIFFKKIYCLFFKPASPDFNKDFP